MATCNHLGAVLNHPCCLGFLSGKILTNTNPTGSAQLLPRSCCHELSWFVVVVVATVSALLLLVARGVVEAVSVIKKYEHVARCLLYCLAVACCHFCGSRCRCRRRHHFHCLPLSCQHV